MKFIQNTVLIGILLLYSIAIKAQPVANFTSNKISGCSPLTVLFTSTSTGGPTSYLWSFGNSNTSTNQNPSAIYVAPGTYTVSLTATNASGSNTKTQISYITVYANPIANFTAIPTAGCIPLPVSFTNTSTIGNGTINSFTWLLGNGNTSTLQHPTTSYPIAGLYNITLSVTDINGCQNAITKNNFISAAPLFTGNFSATNTLSCTAPSTVNFTSTTSVPGTYTYLWKFGDNTTSTSANPSKTYTAVGVYTVELEITSSLGCKQTITKAAFVQIGPINADFSYTTNSDCAPTLIVLTNTSAPTGTTTAAGWQLNGGPSSPTSSFVLNAKTNTIKLTVVNAAGCSHDIQKVITLQDPPIASFTTDKDTFCDFPATVNFTNTSSGASTYSWNFGNSLGSTSLNPSNTYNAEGNYTVTLTANKPIGCKGSTTQTIVVAKPKVMIEDKNLKAGCAPYVCTFKVIDNSTIPLTNWVWELAGSTVSSTKNFTYSLTNPGIYIFKLTGSNAAGCQFIDYDTVKVGEKPLFTITAIPQQVCLNPGLVSLTYVSLNGVVPTSIKWTATNGSTQLTGNGSSLNLLFTKIGVYDLSVEADNNGCKTVINFDDYITILGTEASFKFEIDTCITDTVKYTNTTIGLSNKTICLWEFNDSAGNTSTAINPIHKFDKAGCYLVKLTVTDTANGCIDVYSDTVIIIQKPKVLFTPLDTTICPRDVVQFNSLSMVDASRNILKWTYKISDGRTFSTNNPSVQFTQSGMYSVIHTIEDNYKCEYSFSDSVTVSVYNGNAGFTLSPPTGCVPFSVLAVDTATTENPAFTRNWDWGNNSNTLSTLPNATYTYLAATTNQELGSIVSLTVTDTKGCTFTSSKAIKPFKPKADFTTIIGKACGRDTITLNPFVTAANVNTPAQFNWSLPVGNSNSQFIKFVYSGDTTFPVKLLLQDSLGCKDSITYLVKVDSRPPEIAFDANPRFVPCYSDTPKVTITYTDYSTPGGSAIIKREWNFGNGITPTKTGDTPTVQNIYINPGKYKVSLKITDAVGCIDSSSVPDFIVVGGPIGTYTFNPKKGCSPLEVFFQTFSQNSAKYVWDHGEGNVDTFTVDTHSYIYNEGKYYPRLFLIDSTLRCTYPLDTISAIEVLPLPKVNFSSTRQLICKDNFVSFLNTTPPHPTPILKWKWTFGLNDTSLLKQVGNKQFTQEGNYTISLEAIDTNGCYASITKDSFLTVIDDTIPPSIPLVRRATVENNSEVLLQYNANVEPDFDKYIIYTTTNQYNVSNIIDTSMVEQNLNTLLNPYNYTIAAIDLCLNLSALSEEHTTVELKAIGTVNSVLLNWTPYHGFDTSKVYEIWRKVPEDNALTYLTTVNGDTLHYIDSSVLCNQQYYYRIKIIETDSTLQTSWSDTAGATPIYNITLPIPENIRATVEDNRFVKLEWHFAKHNRVFTYHIYRSVDSGEVLLYKILSSSDTILIDENVNVQEHSYNYTTYLVDACGGKSEASNIARSILLKVKMVKNDILTHDPKLNWNAYYLWESGVDHYSIYFLNDASKSFEQIAQNNNDYLEATHKYVNLIQNDYCYKTIAYKQGDSSIISESNLACVSTAPRMYAPNVFSINGDNLNDKFYVKGVFVETFTLKIYNRWGQLVFETTDMNNGWDGTFEGEPCKSDVFVYLAEGIGRKGQRINHTGNVTLLR
jgi:gliding motility-associated-like protein